MTPDAPPTDPATPRPTRGVILARWLELAILFLLIPAAFWWTRLNPGVAADALAKVGITGRLAQAIAGGRLMIPTLLVFTLLCLVWLIVDRRFPNRQLWNFRAGARDLPRILAIFVPGAAIVSGLVWLLQPGSSIIAEAAEYGLILPTLDANASWLRLPRQRPGLWVAIMILYPLLSVWPQEVVYRAFFHHRYEVILPGTLTRILMSALVFGFMHVVFLNWLAPAMTLLGGLLFAWTYERSRSLLAVTIEHALWGCLVFTIGIGWYFYGGR
ncbi:MAG: CPBP family intramembrane glutamic endopeptidase [Phycisphaerales bacterium JB059]